MRAYTANELFPKIKFMNEDHMETVFGEDSLCALVATYFKEPESNWEDWWFSKRWDVKEGLHQRRNYTTDKVKIQFYGMTVFVE